MKGVSLQQIDTGQSASQLENAQSSGRRQFKNEGNRRGDQRLYRPKTAVEDQQRQQQQRDDWSARRVKQDEDRRVQDQNNRSQGRNQRDRSSNGRTRGYNNQNGMNRDNNSNRSTEDRSATLFDMWNKSQAQEKPQNSGNRRSKKSADILARTPSLKDLNSMTFSPHGQFEENDIVLAPRTRGGFSYARVIKQNVERNCFFDPHNEHSSVLWRVVYLNNGNSLFKDIPAVYIGRLPSQPKENNNNNNELTAEEREQNRNDDVDRIVGDRPYRKDLDRVVFSPHQTFYPDEIVLAPRSRGGFSYGRIIKEGRQMCPISGSSPSEVISFHVMISLRRADAQS